MLGSESVVSAHIDQVLEKVQALQAIKQNVQGKDSLYLNQCAQQIIQLLTDTAAGQPQSLREQASPEEPKVTAADGGVCYSGKLEQRQQEKAISAAMGLTTGSLWSQARNTRLSFGTKKTVAKIVEDKDEGVRPIAYLLEKQLQKIRQDETDEPYRLLYNHQKEYFDYVNKLERERVQLVEARKDHVKWSPLRQGQTVGFGGQIMNSQIRQFKKQLGVKPRSIVYQSQQSRPKKDALGGKNEVDPHRSTRRNSVVEVGSAMAVSKRRSQQQFSNNNSRQISHIPLLKMEQGTRLKEKRKTKEGAFRKAIDIQTYNDILQTTRYIKPGEQAFELGQYLEFNSNETFNQSKDSDMGRRKAKKDPEYLMTFRKDPKLAEQVMASARTGGRSYNFDSPLKNGCLNQYYRYDYDSSLWESTGAETSRVQPSKSFISVHNRKRLSQLNI